MKPLYAVTVTLYVHAENESEAHDIIDNEIDFHIHSKTSDSEIQDYGIVEAFKMNQEDYYV